MSFLDDFRVQMETVQIKSDVNKAQSDISRVFSRRLRWRYDDEDDRQNRAGTHGYDPKSPVLWRQRLLFQDPMWITIKRRLDSVMSWKGVLLRWLVVNFIRTARWSIWWTRQGSPCLRLYMTSCPWWGCLKCFTVTKFDYVLIEDAWRMNLDLSLCVTTTVLSDHLVCYVSRTKTRLLDTL